MTDEVNEEVTEDVSSPWQELVNKTRSKNQAAADFAANVRSTRAVMEAEEQARLHPRPGFWKETGKATWGAAVDLVSEGTILAAEVSRTILPLDQVWEGTKAAANGEGFMSGVAESDRQYEQTKSDLRGIADQIAPENETMLGAGARGILTFMLPYVGWAKAAGAANTFRTATARGAAIDFSLFDPNQGNLSNLIGELSPELQGEVWTFLATDPDDDEALNRFRNALEGGVLGAAFEGIFKMARHAHHTNKVRKARARADESPDQMLTKKQIDELKAKGDIKEPEVKPEAEPKAEAQAKPEGDTAPAQAPEAGGSAKTFLTEQHIRQTLQLTPAHKKAFQEALLNGDDKSATQILELNDFNINTMDWENIQNPEDIKRLLNTVSEVMADHIDDVKGGIQTHEMTARMGNLVGKTGDQVHSLFKDVRSDGGIAARFYAAKRTMMMAAREAEKLIREAKAAPGDKAKQSAVFKHLQLYSAIQSEVKGAQTEIGRALNAMKILADDADEGFKEFDEIMRSFGTKGNSSKAFESYMDSLLDALERGDIDGFNRGVRMTTGERAKNIVIEYVINAMLSSPKTHAINMMSNALNTGLFTLDRTLAGAYRKMRYGDHAAWQEARIDVIRKISSVQEAWKMAKMAWKEGAPISDKRQRLEFRTRQAISRQGVAREVMPGDDQFANLGEKFNARSTEVVRDSEGTVVAAVDFSMLDRAVNTLGRYIRVPGRALITGDEFFKTINRNAELSVLSFRQADDEAVAQGLKWGTPEYEKFVDKRAKSLVDPTSRDPEAKRIRLAAVDSSRRQAFQESPTTGYGGKMESWVNHSSFFKLMFAPFFRTPMNILRQATMDRMPWGRFMDETKEVLKNGHPRAKAEAEARMLTGISAMTASYLVMSGTNQDSKIEFVGKVPYDSVRKDMGIKDYSIRIGDTWYQFNRLDPLGMWVGMMSDISNAVQSAEDRDEDVDFAMLQGALGTFLGNVTDKTWMKSLSDFLEFAEGVSKEGTSSETAQRAWGKFAGGQLGKFVPQMVKSVGRKAAEVATGDETKSYETWTAWETLQAQLPWFNKDLPKRYDNLGRERSYSTEVMNPFAKSEGLDSPIEKELFRLNFKQQSMPRAYGNVRMPLSEKEYSKMNQLVGEKWFSGLTLEEKLNELVTRDSWAEKTRERKIFEIKIFVNQARAAATASMLKDKDFRKRYQAAIRDPLERLVTPKE